MPPRTLVASRPVEKFDTELKLPSWQIEPDDEAIFANPDNYSMVDDQGNLIEPPAGKEPRAPLDGGPGEPMVNEQGGLVNVPPAANNDFLDQATGDKRGKN